MSHIQEEIRRITRSLPQGVKLVAISKYHPEASIMQAYEAGQRIFGESHEQELRRKHLALPGDIEWHFIGHLQSNKVKYIAPYVSMIHAVDSYKLLCEINKQAEKCNRTINCLLQLHVAQEETKYGFTPDECIEMLSTAPWQQLSHVRICGLMSMASNTDDTQRIRADFRLTKETFNHIKTVFFAQCDTFKECSMGMSHDYPIAIEEGSTLIRVGSLIFGDRVY